MVIGLFPELEAVGGVQRSGRHMAAVLASVAARRGLSYHLYSLNDTNGQHEERVGDLTFRFTGFRRSKASFVWAAVAAARYRPRVVFAAHPHLAPVGWLIKRLTRARMAAVGHGIDVWRPLPLVRRRALQGADAVLAVSTYTAERITQAQGVPPSNVRLLPLAIEPAFWKAAQEKRVYPLPAEIPKGRLILSVTRLPASAGYKGVDTVIRALPRIVPRVPDVQYVVVGDGEDRLRLTRLSSELEVADRVHFVGQLPAAGLLSLYANCDVFVLPSKVEGFGLVFLEAMAFAKPVVGGAHGGTPDIIEDGVTGFLAKHGEVEALSRILERLLADAQLRCEMGRLALERVRTRYLFEHFERHLSHVIEELCGFSTRPAPRS